MKFQEFLKQKLKIIRYFCEAIIVKFGLWGFFVMRPQLASDMSAWLSKFIGKKLPVHKLAYENLRKAMPQLSEVERRKILDDMWDNLGRIVGEFPHIANCPINQIEHLVGLSDESLKNIEAVKKSGKGGIIFSGHMGNWEVGPKVFSNQGLRIKSVYRPLNNPYVERMTASIRGSEMIEKSASGSRKIIEMIKSGGFVIIMADQKVSEGEPVQFFHDLAITATSMARIALKYDVPLIPVRSIRIGKDFKFRVEVEKPLAFEKTSNLNSDLLRLTREINSKLEEWIKEYPSQWFWVHNRWKK
jgi:KDO2-lipid IV(A) lauroyltransferase